MRYCKSIPFGAERMAPANWVAVGYSVQPKALWFVLQYSDSMFAIVVEPKQYTTDIITAYKHKLRMLNSALHPVTQLKHCMYSFSNVPIAIMITDTTLEQVVRIMSRFTNEHH